MKGLFCVACFGLGKPVVCCCAVFVFLVLLAALFFFFFFFFWPGVFGVCCLRAVVTELAARL
jgi:hypothetical protein